MLGLVAMAKKAGATASFSNMVDFIPMNFGADPAERSPWDVFDHDNFWSVVSDWPVSKAPATETVSMHDCFKASSPFVNELVNRRRVGGAASTLIRATQPSSYIISFADQIASWARKKKAVPVQLRIERDWVRYLKRRGQSTHIASPEFIFEKISKTSCFDEFDAIWACCDEQDLLQSKTELRKISEKYGKELVFKSDISLDLPESRLLRSAIEFHAVVLADAYIGLSKSTFSKMILAHGILGLTSDRQYRFDVNGESLERCQVAPASSVVDALAEVN